MSAAPSPPVESAGTELRAEAATNARTEPDASGAEASGAGASGAEASVVVAERVRARAKIVRWLRGLLVFSGLLPWVLPFARAELPLGPFGVAIDLAFFTMCHRRAPRTLVLDGVAMPLCSRCAGIFLGIALGAIIARPHIALRTWRWVFAIACGLMLTDVVTQDLGLHPVWHPTRILTGFLVGYLMVVGLLAGLARDRGQTPASADVSRA